MDIIIPSSGRSNSQETLDQLNGEGILATLVIPVKELAQYKKLSTRATIITTPVEVNNIGKTRQWIVEHAGKTRYLFMVDDDLKFYKRRLDDRTKFEGLVPGDLRRMFYELVRLLETNAQVGIAARERGHLNTEKYVETTRLLRLLGYNRDILKKMPFRFDDIDIIEDFHVSISLLEHGYPSTLYNDFCSNQGGSNKPGGCSQYRTLPEQDRCARELQVLHPQFVTVVEKETKTAWGGGVRTDVRVQWKKAYEHGQRMHKTGVLDL